MLKLDLGQLERLSRGRIDAAVPADDPLWKGTELTFHGPLEVSLEASLAASGEVWIHGHAVGVLEGACRRCLAPLQLPVRQRISLVFAPRDELGLEDDGDMRPIEAGLRELDLGEPLREELILALPAYAVCDPDCKGLCPRCGVDLNQEPCTCVRQEADPRWDALRALTSE